MKNTWNQFFEEKLKKIFDEKSNIIDIGGGLRVKKGSGNRYDPKNAWILPRMEKVRYQILDPVPDYNPDIIGDIHRLPFLDESQEAILCLAVLEHVEDPKKACREIWRSLKKGGYALVYTPFLYYYHAEPGYYKDYWRFSEDALNFLFKDFSSREMCPVRGAISTWMHLSPLGRVPLIAGLANLLDKISGKSKSRQVSGHYIFLVK
ncbi:MAG: methyltransferase domain-containing protein [Patescibacteria group bacterium]|jgi:SAM-dependent methyltransferase